MMVVVFHVNIAAVMTGRETGGKGEAGEVSEVVSKQYVTHILR